MALRSRHLRMLASALLPGLGQALGGRFVDAALILYAMLWTRTFLVGHAADGERLAALLFGAPGIDGGMRTPVLVVFTGLLLVIHAFAAWDAGGRRRQTGAAVEEEGRARSGDLAP